MKNNGRISDLVIMIKLNIKISYIESSNNLQIYLISIAPELFYIGFYKKKLNKDAKSVAEIHCTDHIRKKKIGNDRNY